MTAHCPRRTYDNYHLTAMEIITVVAFKGLSNATQDEIADLLRSTFPPSSQSPQDGRTLPVAAPSGSHREGSLTDLEAGI